MIGKSVLHVTEKMNKDKYKRDRTVCKHCYNKKIRKSNK